MATRTFSQRLIALPISRRQFTSIEFTEFMSKNGITHQNTGDFAPQANVYERVNQSVLATTWIQGGDHARWDEKLPEI